MGKAKLYRVQAMNDNGMMLNVEVTGRKAQDLALQEALEMCKAQGAGVIRSQTHGARSWAVHVLHPGEDGAVWVFGAIAARHNAAFEAWLATGGAAS